MRRQGRVGDGVGGVGGSGSGSGGNYGGDGNPQHVYPAAPPPQHMQMQQQEQHHPQQPTKSDHHHNQRRWDKDGPKVQSPMSPHMFNEGQESEVSKSYYQGQRPELRMAVEKQCGYGAHSQPRGDENMRFEENPPPHTFEGLEQKFVDDIMKLGKEQNDAEDAEIARHRERINAINAKYQEQLVALRARHASRRFDFLRRESHSRQQQYQKVAVDHYPSSSSSLGPSDPQEYNAVSGATPREPARPYNPDNYDPYRERRRFIGNSRNHEPEPRVQDPRGRVYDTAGSRFY